MNNTFNFTTLAINHKPTLRPAWFVPGAEPWQMALLVATGLTSIAANVLVAVATYRVSRNLHPFILFFSEVLANLQMLVMATIAYAVQLVLPSHPRAEALITALLCSPLLYSGLLHYPLIAANRGSAVFFPLSYDFMWDRRTIIASVWLVWVVSIAVGVPNLLGMPYALTNLIYHAVMAVVTYPSLAIYTAAFAWVLLSRATLLIKRRSQVADTTVKPNNGGGATHAQMDLRMFAYCLVSFLPNCYSMVVRPPMSSLHFQYYSIARPASAGLLLYVMSSVTRKQTPSLSAPAVWTRLRKFLQKCRPNSAASLLQTTNQRNNIPQV